MHGTEIIENVDNILLFTDLENFVMYDTDLLEFKI